MDLNSTILLAIAAAFLAEVIMYLISSSLLAKCSNSCAACEIRLQFSIPGANESGHQIRLRSCYVMLKRIWLYESGPFSLPSD